MAAFAVDYAPTAYSRLAHRDYRFQKTVEETKQEEETKQMVVMSAMAVRRDPCLEESRRHCCRVARPHLPADQCVALRSCPLRVAAVPQRERLGHSHAPPAAVRAMSDRWGSHGRNRLSRRPLP